MKLFLASYLTLTLAVTPGASPPRGEKVVRPEGGNSSPGRLSFRLSDEETPEQILEKIEKVLGKAKTASVKLTQTIERKFRGETANLKRSVTILLMDENRARIEIEESGGRVPDTLLLVSDGKALQASARTLVPRKDLGAPPPNLKESIAASLVRGNVVTTMMSTAFTRKTAPDPTLMEPQKRFKVSDLKEGDKDGAAKTILFTVVIADTTARYSIRLWYDPGSYTVKKRVISYRTGQDEETLTEVLDEVILGMEIPDEKFKRTTDK